MRSVLSSALAQSFIDRVLSVHVCRLKLRELSAHSVVSSALAQSITDRVLSVHVCSLKLREL